MDDIHGTALKSTTEASSSSPQLGRSSDDRAVERALKAKDWERLRELSLRPGGFGEERVRAWYVVGHWNVGREANRKHGRCVDRAFLLGVDTETCQTDALPEGETTATPMLRRRRRSTSYASTPESNEHDDSPGSSSPPPSTEVHPDEQQIKLDTDRSFVLYPVGKRCGPLSMPTWRAELRFGIPQSNTMQTAKVFSAS